MGQVLLPHGSSLLPHGSSFFAFPPRGKVNKKFSSPLTVNLLVSCDTVLSPRFEGHTPILVWVGVSRRTVKRLLEVPRT